MTAFGDILWQPDVAWRDGSQMGRFLALARQRTGLDLPTFADLHRWSVTETAAFWSLTAEFCGWQPTTPATSIYVPPPEGGMRGARWFIGAKLNYAKHLLAGADADKVLIAYAEGAPRRTMTRGELRRDVARVASALRHAGVGPGDCVAGVIANIPEALIAMLATTALGGVWASCSPDFGAAAVADRLGQIAPKVVFHTRDYVYHGKHFDLTAQAAALSTSLPAATQVVLVPHLETKRADGNARDGAGRGVCLWNEFLACGTPAPLCFEPRAFSDPLFILFSSGTTGVPKCIVHSVGGTLLQHLKELRLHSDIGPGSRLLYYTTCGWMMWNWMVSALATGAALVLYEGSVAAPDLATLWRVISSDRVTAFGTSPKFIATCMQAGIDARGAMAGFRPRTILSTGSPLLPEHYAWIYEQAGPDLHLASISGGTDIISCFMLGTPLLPVRAGEIQYAGLGMDLDAWDGAGRAVRGVKAELVCKTPFPSQPLGFLHDADGERYRRAYFDFYPPGTPEVWRHGDFIEINAHGGVVVYGRSDATLNPGGVRIGTAELYRQVESIAEVADSLAVGRKNAAGDEHIVLFVKLRPGQDLDAALINRIKTRVRQQLTPRHVPQEVIAVGDIPYTRSGKKVELAVTQAIHGEEVPNLAAIANAEAMAEYFAMAPKKG